MEFALGSTIWATWCSSSPRQRNRLTEANYSNGDYYHYAYDAVGNRETQTTFIGGVPSTTNYVYDDANRLSSVNGVNYSWDNNGNLLNDGTNTYTYDSANRLKTLSGQGNNVTYAYSGLGDRLRETVNGNPTTFTMDLNPSTSLRAGSSLTQALSDGTKAYIYGNGRIAQAAGMSTEYFLGDALGSVRQLTNASAAITYAKAYDPYGVVTTTSGASSTAYGYTGEFTSNNLVYLRARMYAPDMGRFITKDPSGLESNLYLYTNANPINRIDPTGLFSREQIAKSFGFDSFSDVVRYYDTHGKHWGFLAALLRALPGDYLISEQARIEPFIIPHKNGKAFQINYAANGGITLDGNPLQAIFALNSSANPTKGLLKTAPWRSSDAIYYTVKNSLAGKEVYVDNPLKTDIPDFWAISGSAFIVQGMYLVDRFGHKYFTGGITISTSDVGAAYVEGYVGVPYSNGMHHYVPEQELYEHLGSWAFCFSGEANIIIGISGALCLNQTFIGMYSLGVQLTAGGGLAPYTWDLGKDPSLAWNWVIEDMAGGVSRDDLFNIQEIGFNGCNDQLLQLHVPNYGN